LTIDTIGFGRLIVSGLRRLPSPPAMTTACIGPSVCSDSRWERMFYLIASGKAWTNA
jgi:hypothetical protein